MNMICKSCLQECEEVTVNEGFYYDYGSISNAWHDESYEGSSCCGEEVVEGKLYLDRVGVSIAAKDHYRNGKVKIPKGTKYRWRIQKGYMVKDGIREGVCEYSKRIVN